MPQAADTAPPSVANSLIQRFHINPLEGHAISREERMARDVLGIAYGGA